MAKPSGKLSIEDLVAGLCSSKKIDRKAAVETLEGFAQSGAIEGLPLEAFPNVYKGVLRCLSLDRTLCISKGLQKATATDLARWEKSADMLRRVVDRTVKLINNTVVKSLVRHLLESIRFGGKLVSTISLNYCKVFCKLLEYPPHLDHLGLERWLELSKFAWAVVLGDALTADSGWEEEGEAGRREGEEDDMALSDGKRSQQGTGRKSTFNSMSPDQIACCTLIKLLNSSCYSPFTRAINDPKIPSGHSNIGSNILRKFIRYFDTYPNEATGHVDMLPALRHVLERMELNATDSFVWFSRSVWPSLVSLLGTRTKDMREELLVILRILLPLFAWDKGKDSSHPDSADGLRKFVNTFEREVLNRGLEPLSPDSMRLDIVAEDEPIAAFYARTYRRGSMFSFSQAMTWVALDLYSNSLAHVRCYLTLAARFKSGLPFIRCMTLQSPSMEM
jgi:ataxia telangiectasia mutated family protein